MTHEVSVAATQAKRNRTLVQTLKYFLLGLATIIVILPIIVIFLGSFKTGEEFNRATPFDLPSFTSDTEVWKGGRNLSEGNGIAVTAGNLKDHEIRRLTLVIDDVTDGAVINVGTFSEPSLIKINPRVSDTEAKVIVDDATEAKLLENGFSVTGQNCTVRRIKILEGFSFDNYITAFVKGKMALGFWNTFILIFFSGIGTVLTGSMTAFVLSRFKFTGKKIVYTMFLWIALIPTITTQVATFQIIQKLGMYNTRLSCIILSMGTDIISIMIYLQFLNNISVSLDESAIMDGANYFQVFSKIIFPLLQPATVTILILKCVNLYNDFYNPLLYMPKSNLMVISTSLYKFKGPFGTNWPVICAGVVIAVIPTLVVFIALQKYIYNGMVSGSVKE